MDWQREIEVGRVGVLKGGKYRWMREDGGEGHRVGERKDEEGGRAT